MKSFLAVYFFLKRHPINSSRTNQFPIGISPPALLTVWPQTIRLNQYGRLGVEFLLQHSINSISDLEDRPNDRLCLEGLD